MVMKLLVVPTHLMLTQMMMAPTDGNEVTAEDSTDNDSGSGNNLIRGTNPTDADSDDDGLNDGDEVTRGTDPTDADSDDDGLNDGDEVTRGTDPMMLTPMMMDSMMVMK